jgi:hypothetical protein
VRARFATTPGTFLGTLALATYPAQDPAAPSASASGTATDLRIRSTTAKRRLKRTSAPRPERSPAVFGSKATRKRKSGFSWRSAVSRSTVS